MSQTLRNVAGALGAALLVTIMTNAATSHAKDLVIAGKIDPKDAAAMADVTHHATVFGINYSFEIATWMTLAALVLAFFIRKTSPTEEPVVEKEA
ncbi:hypothetical protein D3C86_1974030 [compost metagenome]